MLEEKPTIPRIEYGMMITELELDGIKTHITMRKEKCPLYNTAFDLKVRRALSATRSARDVFRNWVQSKQRSITTRGKSANRHGLWEANPKPSFKCPFCNVEVPIVKTV